MHGSSGCTIRPVKRFLLAAACSARHGDFATRHWLPSLVEHVALDDIDVVLFDYGIGESSRRALRRAGIEVVEVRGRGDIRSSRHQALADLLRARPYEQATLVDCGDLIFQRDISNLFRQHTDQFRAVCEDVCCDFLGFMMDGGDFEPSMWRHTLHTLRDHPMINGSGVLAPRERWLEFEQAFRNAAPSRDRFGTDQAFLNLYLHRKGFVRLPSTWNFSLKTTRESFTIRDSRFYDRHGELIAVVHNTGGKPASRAIRDFGYGRGCNRGVRRLRRWATRLTYVSRRKLRR